VPRVVVVHPAEAGPDLRRLRDDAIVRERRDGDDRFVADEGPFRRYERTLRTLPDGRIEEQTRFTLAGGVWSRVFDPGFRRALRRRPVRTPWWAPPERLDARAASVLALLCSLSLVGGYLGTLMTQTVTFAADEFGSTTTAQASALATTRVGVLVAVVLSTLADRAGRRRMVLVAAGAGCLLAATGALAPSLAALGASQTVARGFASALLLLIAIVSAEEMPAGSRAYAYSLLTMTAGLGAGMCLWVLPIADLDDQAWRVLYVVPLAFLPLVASVHRRLPETRRFARQHAEAPVRGHGRRFWLLAVTGALLAVFAAPASQLQNEFLREERGFSAAMVSLFTMATVTPAGIGIVAGGRLADLRGRRAVAAVGTLGGTVLTVLQFAVPGFGMWLWATLGSILAGLVVPAYGVYRSELFPTSLRGRLGGVVEAMAVAGSATGLLVVGSLVDGGWSYNRAFWLLALAPAVVVVVLLAAFPETAHRSLEDLNPEDRGDSPRSSPAASP
jgi:MFS family permease